MKNQKRVQWRGLRGFEEFTKANVVSFLVKLNIQTLQTNSENWGSTSTWKHLRIMDHYYYSKRITLLQFYNFVISMSVTWFSLYFNCSIFVMLFSIIENKSFNFFILTNQIMLNNCIFALAYFIAWLFVRNFLRFTWG